MILTGGKKQPSRDEIIELIRRLPDDIVCSSLSVEFEDQLVSVTSIDSPPDGGNMEIFRVRVEFQRAWQGR